MSDTRGPHGPRPENYRPTTRRPVIGVFDSGVGGLTVLRALVDRIPAADYLYFGDTARLPYGSKSAATVAHYAVGAIRHLQAHGAELLVIACNTATALAFDEIQAASQIAVVGVVEPGAHAAAVASRSRKVVVIGTEATIASHAYRRALEARNVAVKEKACPLFVPLVEEGWIDHPVTEQVARIYLDEAFSHDLSDGDLRSNDVRGNDVRGNDLHNNDLRNSDLRSNDVRNNDVRKQDAREADVLVLGCTHYPLIRPLLSRIAPPHVSIVDSAESTAHEVARQLQIEPLASSTEPERRSAPRLKFFATDSAEKFKKMGSRFLGLPVEDVVHVDLKE